MTPVPYDNINNVVAPDASAHVCAPVRSWRPASSPTRSLLGRA